VSNTRAYTPESALIINRFFHAIEALVAAKKLRGRQTYCTLAGIDFRNFNKQRLDPDRGYFQVSWLLPLIKQLGVSSEWLLFGEGEMFRTRSDGDV
jgi:hypothetical protein